ncbi:efflux RND transporter periplasmic adaptor subunit [Pseudorhodoferax sp. Leaf274]|uniref:efflux RND transporter periplasmic adaptor subunit n=1 Tax=Pseudorhodoferax sp. Leaf274 TaxID=1736318 RepID=UPI0007033976|nr:efflux RND transporter periplasmic adaptor subunit [Pseudorhodoferax sp. Leaf274]KQP43075.1 secretion protein HlyD [Pseudorhodoferax sp. Leaf274]
MDHPPTGHVPPSSSLPPPPLQPPSRRRRWVGALVTVAVLAALVGGSYYLVKRPAETAGGLGMGPRGPGGAGGPGGPPGGAGAFGMVTVGHAAVARAQIPVTLDALGTVTPTATVTLKPQVGGVLTEVLFTEGQTVRKGQLLARIDPRPYEQALMQARGTRMRDEAQLQAARVTLARYRTLLGQDSIARQDVDTQAALVQQLEGTVTSDKAAEGAAAVNLEFTRITAPLSGRIGLRTVDPGNMVAAGSATGIAVITQMNPIDVQFAVPQDRIPEVQEQVRGARPLAVAAMDRTRSAVLDQGSFSTLDNVVDTTTGTVKAKARFANGDGKLFPNQFVNVRMTLRTLDALVVPVTAVRTGPQGPYVYVIGADRTVAMRRVKRGEATVDVVAVTEGLQAGELVVTEGGDRLSEGSRVRLQGEVPAAGPRGPGGGRRHGQGAAAPGTGASAPANPSAAAPAPLPARPGASGPQPPAATAPPPSGQPPSAQPESAGLPTAEQRSRMLESVKDDPEKLAQRKQFLEALDRGDPEALARWQNLQQRRRPGS